MKKTEIAYLISDAINVGYDNYAELRGFCKGLEVSGRKDLAAKILGLYKSHADEDDVVRFVSEKFEEAED